MKQRWNVVAVVAVIMLVALAPLAAQVWNPTSNTNSSTATLFSNEIDKIVSTTNYSSAVAGKSLAFTKISATALDLGYATKLGDIYLGTYYNGSLLQGGTITADTVTTNYEESNGQLVDTTKTVVSTAYTTDSFTTTNEINVLVGLAGHGIKVGFYENLTGKEAAYNAGGTENLTVSSVTTNATSKNVTSVVYSDRTNLVGNIKPSIGWGSNFALGNMTLVPEAQIVADFYQNKQAYTLTKSVKKGDAVVYNTAAGTEDNGKTTYVSEGGYIQPSATLSAKLKFPKVDGAQTAVKLAYNFKTDIYGSAGGTTITTNKEYVTRSAAFDTTTVTSKQVETIKASSMTNTITPQVTYTKDLDEAISVGVDFKAPIEIKNTSSGSSTQNDTTTKLVSASQNRASDKTTVASYSSTGLTTVTSSLTVTPTLKAGVQYKVIPGRLTLNGGLTVTIPDFKNTVVTVTPAGTTKYTQKETDGNGAVTSPETVTTSSTSGTYTDTRTTTNRWASVQGLTQNISFGGVFNFTDKFALDMKSDISGTTLSVLGTTLSGGSTVSNNGLLTTSMSLAFIIKN